MEMSDAVRDIYQQSMDKDESFVHVFHVHVDRNRRYDLGKAEHWLNFNVFFARAAHRKQIAADIPTYVLSSDGAPSVVMGFVSM